MQMPHAHSIARGRVTRSLLAELACVSALVLACVAPAGASAQTSSTTTTTTGQTGDGTTPTISATLEQCLTTGEQADRSATFSGEMTAMTGTARMEVRIEVQEQMDGEETFHTVSAPALGVWRGSDPGVKIYKYVRQVTNLSGPADYRALVHFHWLNDKGDVVRRAERFTPTCVQPAPEATPAPVT
jgi:hypothetical protein